ncbi:MAG: chemotaxis-specific protein-glutamate methyltransferase CheB [Candidatus Thermoplasmatota archaeon]
MIRAVVVDDSSFMVTVLSDILEKDESIEVIGRGKNGEEAIELNQEVDPDVILMDIEMPVMDGLTALKKIMSDNPTPVIIISGMDDKDADNAVKALTAGAVDYIEKTSGTLSLDIRKKSKEIIRKVKKGAQTGIKDRGALEKEREKSLRPKKTEDHLVTIASSTGGVRALSALLAPLPPDFPAPIVLVQHIPPEFSTHLASTLDHKIDLSVKEASDRELLEEGVVYIVPADSHGTVIKQENKKCIKLNNKPKVNGVRPSADYLFRSASEVYGENTVGVILSGMGKDGAVGAECIKKEDGFLAVQEKESCVVNGMPKAAKKRAGADFVDTPLKIGEKLIDLFMERY